MKLRIEIDGTEHSAILESIKINKQLAGRMSTAAFDIAVQTAGEGTYGTAIYDTSRYDDDSFSFPTFGQQSEVIVYNDATDEKVFRGFITSVGRIQKNKNFQVWSIACCGLEFLLENIKINRSWTAKTDRFILQDAFTDFLPEITTDPSTVESLSGSIDFEAKDLSLRELVEQLSTIAGSEWLLSNEKELLYRTPLSVDASFGFASTPDALHSPIYKKWVLESRERTSTQFANRLTLLGAFNGTNGAELRSTVENLASQADLGRVIEAIEVDRTIFNQAALDLAANILLETRCAVQENISFSYYEDGLDIGQVVEINSPASGIVGNYLINTLSLSQISPDVTKYTAAIGDWKPTLQERLRILNKVKDGGKLVTASPPPPNSVNDSMISDVGTGKLVGTITAGTIDSVNASAILGLIDAGQINTITASQISGSITSSQIGSVNATAVTGTLSSSQIGSVAATTITGSITSGQIGSVAATTITGVIISSQVADNLIDSLSKLSSALRPIPLLASAPSLPDTNYPTNSFYYNTGSGTFYQNIAGTWTSSTEATAVTGKLQFFNLGTIKATNIVGLIAAAQINTIAATQITGSITSAQIGSVAAVSITGTLTSSQIASVAASTITGTITSSQIASVSASTITGLISAAQITSITAAQITGSISAGQIASITFGQVTGTVSVAAANITGSIAAAQITSITAGQITGSISAGQITSITFGQITGTVSVAAANITGTITSGQISSVLATSITGTITSGQIASVSVGTLVGQIVGSQITNLTINGGTHIIDSTITNAKIVSLDVSKLNAGTISASISITSPNITSTSGSNTVTLTGAIITVQGSTARTVISQGEIKCTILSNSERTFISGQTLSQDNTAGHTTCFMDGFGLSFGQSNSGRLVLANSSASTKVELGVDSSGDGVIRFNAGSNYALWTGANKKKLVGGVIQFSGSSYSLSTGLSGIDSVTLTLATGGTTVYHVSTSGFSGGSVTLYTDSPSNPFCSWMALGTA